METWLESHCNAWFTQADSSPHCHNLESMLTDVAWLYPHSNRRVGGMISICSFHVPILGVGRVSAENGYLACSRSRTGSWNWNPGPWLPAQTTSHWMALSIGWCKCHSYPWGWEVDSYLHTRIQTSSCSQALHVISTGKLPKLVRDGGEGGKKEQRRRLSHASEWCGLTISLSTQGTGPPFTMLSRSLRTPLPW